MKFKAKVLNTKIDEQGRMIAKIQCNQKLPPIGTVIDIHFGSKRNLAQNAFLWKYYSFVINDIGLKDHGFFCPEALHASLKAKFLSDKIIERGEWKSLENGSTAILNKADFAEYIEKIDNFICDFFEVDTSSFFKDYEEFFKP